MNVPSDNAKHFPNDAVWQRHCEKMARVKWDSRLDHHEDYLAPRDYLHLSEQHIRNVINGDV